MLLINSSFVGGLGAARKTASFIKFIENRTRYSLLTDSASARKLELFGLKADTVVPVSAESQPEEIYSAVRESLSAVDYDAMISFGWRTYVPADAIGRDRPVLIVDGGWPEKFESYPSPFWKDVYSRVDAYCLTNHFGNPELTELISSHDETKFRWIFHPFQQSEILWHLNLRQKIEQIKPSLPFHVPGHRVIFLNMDHDYISPIQGTFTGGWLNPKQIDECRGFVTRLIVELDALKQPLILVTHETIAAQFEPVIAQCRFLKVFSHPALSLEQHHIWRACADLVLLRAARSVGAAQVALSGIPALHTICPATGNYMGELSSCQIAQQMGIAKYVDHQAVSIADSIMNHLDSDESKELADLAQIEAITFWCTNGPENLLNLLS
jgi:hypothetical protein